MKKVLYFDVETTGLDPVKQDIIQLAGIIEVEGEIVDYFNLALQPFNYDTIDLGALTVNNTSIEMLKGYPDPKVSYLSFITILEKYCDKFDKEDKYYPAGYNVSFDLNFLAEFFKKNNDKYLGSWLNWKALDPLPLFRFLDWSDDISLPNYKLETVCNYLGFEIEDAHDALSDIKATRKVIKWVENKFLHREV